MLNKILVLALTFVFATTGLLWAQTGLNSKNMLRKNEPIEIVSDRMEAFQEKKMVVFSGNVEATQGEIKLKSDRITVYYKDSNQKKEKAAKHDIGTSGEMDRIEATGHVKITQKQMSATGDEAVYHQDTAQITMTGNPVLQDGNNTIKGCRVVIYINENRGKVEKCETGDSKRVTATIVPQGKK